MQLATYVRRYFVAIFCSIKSYFLTFHSNTINRATKIDRIVGKFIGFIYTLLCSLWEGYKFLIATVVYLLPLLLGAKKHGYVKQLIQYGLAL